MPPSNEHTQQKKRNQRKREKSDSKYEIKNSTLCMPFILEPFDMTCPIQLLMLPFIAATIIQTDRSNTKDRRTEGFRIDSMEKFPFFLNRIRFALGYNRSYQKVQKCNVNYKVTHTST